MLEYLVSTDNYSMDFRECTASLKHVVPVTMPELTAIQPRRNVAVLSSPIRK